MGLAGAVSGNGTQADPWIVPVSPGALSIDLAGWNDQTSHNAADPQQLRLGLRASAVSAPWNFTWLCELLAFDLPASGDTRVALLGGQHIAFSLAPVPASTAVAGVSIAADALSITLDFALGSATIARAVISGITVTSGADTIHIPALSFPPPGGFVITPDLEKAFRWLFSVAIASWLPEQGASLAALLGLSGNFFGLPADWPLVPSGFLSDPFSALKTWLGQIAVNVSANQTPFLPQAMQLVSPLFGGGLGEVSGSGIYDDPWAVPVDGGVELLTWLEPSGPPVNWTATIPAAISASASFDDLFTAAEGLQRLLAGVAGVACIPEHCMVDRPGITCRLAGG